MFRKKVEHALAASIAFAQEGNIQKAEEWKQAAINLVATTDGGIVSSGNIIQGICLPDYIHEATINACVNQALGVSAPE